MCKIDSDKIFTERKKINAILDKLNHENITFGDVNGMIVKLAKHDSHQLNDILLKRLSGKDNDFYVANYILRELGSEEIVPDIVKLIFNNTLTDEKKAILVSLLDEMNADIEDIDFNSAFENIEEMSMTAVENLINEISNNHVDLDKAVNWIYEIPEIARMSFIDSICKVANINAFTFLQKILTGDDAELIKRILNNLSKSNDPQAMRAINHALPYASDPEIKELMERSSRKMSFKGIQESENIFDKEVKLGDIYKIAITNIDGAGSQSLWMSRILGKKLECIFLLLNEDLGLKDCFGNNMTKKEYESMMERQFSDSVQTTEISYEKAISFIKDAININTTKKVLISPSFHFLKQKMIKEKVLIPEEYVPDFKGYKLEEIKANKDLQHMTELVMEIVPDCESWFIVNKDIYDIAEKILKKSKSQEVVVPSKKQLQEFAAKVIGDLIPQLKRRLIFTADLINSRIGDNKRIKSSKDMKKQVEILLCAALNINTKIEENDFLLSIAEDSIYQAQISLINGFDYREKPEIFQ